MLTSEATRQTSRLGRILVLALVAMLIMTHEARAQMLPFVPDPVTTPELAQYADILGLSDEQRLVILDIHDVYRDEFRTLEDVKVKTFIQDLTGLVRVFMRDGFRIPERAVFEDLIDQLDKIIAKAQSLDRRLFDQIASILTEPALTNLESVRIERELDISRTLMEGPGELNPGALVMLSSIVRELDLNDEERALTEEPLRQYERGVVRRTRKLYRLLKDAATLALDTLDRIGVRDMTQMDMMQLGADESFQNDMRATFDEGSKAIQAELFAASQQNLRFLKQMTDILTPDNAEALRDRFLRDAFTRVYRRASEWRDLFARALALESMDESRRQKLAVQRDEFRRQEDQLIDRIVRRVEASREYRTSEQLEEDGSELDERVDAYREDRTNLGEQAMEALTAMLTSEELESVTSTGSSGQGASDDMVGVAMSGAGGGGGGGGDTIATIDMGFRFAGLGMPAALAVERRDQIADLAGLDEGERSVLETLCADYRENYDAALERMSQEDTAADDADGGGSDDVPEDEKARTERAESRRAELAAMDDALFETMALVLDEDAGTAISVARSLRARERATSAAAGEIFVFGREESYVDLIGVILEMPQSADIFAGARPIIEEYEQAMGQLVDARLEAVRAVQLRIRMMSRLEEMGPGDMAEAFAGKLAEVRRRVKAMDGRIRDENRQRLAEMENELDDDLGWTLRLAFQRKAFPEIYADELGLDNALRSARELDDLTGSQRERVNTISSDYRLTFSRLSERMVELRRQRDFDIMAFQMPSQDVIEGELELERLRFDRHEAGSRAILRLRIVLTESQIARSRLRQIPAPRRSAFD